MQTNRAPAAVRASELSWVLVVGALLGLAASATALVLRNAHQAPTLTLVLIVAFGTAPMALALARWRPGPAWGWLALAAGLPTLAFGAWTAWRQDSLHLLRMDFSLVQVAANAAVVLSPVALTGLGIAVLLAGAARLSGDRTVTVLATLFTVALSTVFGAALLANSVHGLQYRGGSVERGIVLASALVGAATLLLPVALTVQAPERPVPPSTPVPRIPTRLAAVLSLTAVLVGIGVWSYVQLGDRIRPADLFPDAALATCVASRLQLEDARTPTSARELDSIFALECNGDRSSSGRIRSLAGLEHLPNLGTLDVSTNQISDLEPLRRTPGITDLKLTNNQVADLAPVAALSQLRELGASGNRISDLTPLAGLTGLYAAGLSGNQIADVEPLSGLTELTELDLGDNQVSETGPLDGLLVLDRLTLRENNIRDLTALPVLPRLTMLDVSGNHIKDVSPLTRMPMVSELWIGGNPMTDVDPLRRMPALIGVDLEGSDPNRLRGLPALREKGVYVGGLA